MSSMPTSHYSLSAASDAMLPQVHSSWVGTDLVGRGKSILISFCSWLCPYWISMCAL